MVARGSKSEGDHICHVTDKSISKICSVWLLIINLLTLEHMDDMIKNKIKCKSAKSEFTNRSAPPHDRVVVVCTYKVKISQKLNTR